MQFAAALWRLLFEFSSGLQQLDSSYSGSDLQECLGTNRAMPDEPRRSSARRHGVNPSAETNYFGNPRNPRKTLDSGMHSRVDTSQGSKRIATTLHSGAVAKASGVSPDTIRHYEKIGLLPKASRTESGYRVYPESAVERVLVVQRALRIGFTLSELAEVLKARDAGGAPCQRVYALAKEKLSGITADIEALRQTEKYLKQVLGDWEHRMQQTLPAKKSNLLHSLTGPVNGSKAKATPFRRIRK